MRKLILILALFLVVPATAVARPLSMRQAVRDVHRYEPRAIIFDCYQLRHERAECELLIPLPWWHQGVPLIGKGEWYGENILVRRTHYGDFCSGDPWTPPGRC